MQDGRIAVMGVTWMANIRIPDNLEKAIDISCIQVELLVKSTFINVLSALKWQASLNSSLNGKIKVDLVKMTIFEVILPHRKGLIAIGAIWAFLNKLRVLLLV